MTETDDGIAAPFWQAAEHDRLVIQKCASCSEVRWPPMPGCPECLTPGGDWVEVAASGQISSFVRYHKSLNPAFDADVPYVVALVSLDDGLELVGRVVEPADAVHVGARVRGRFDPVDDGRKLLKWSVVHDA